MARRRWDSAARWGCCSMLLCALLSLVACGAEDLEVRGIGFGTDSKMDVYALPSLSQAPVAVVLHGGSTDGRKQLTPFASELARRNTVVFVPEWPAITDVGSFSEDPERSLVEQTVVVICALREARAVAAQFGGDGDHLTLIATSQAGAVAVRAALSTAEAWPEAECKPSVDHSPQLVIGLAGNYSGGWYRNLVSPIDLWRRFDPLRFVDDHRPIQAVFLHGMDDTNVMPQESENVDLAFRLAGHDSLYVQTEGEHATLIRPWTPSGSFTVDLVESLLNAQRNLLSERPVVDAVYDEAGCNVTTLPVVESGRPFEARLANHSDGEVWLLVFRVDERVANPPELGSTQGHRFETQPPFMHSAALRNVAPRSSDDAIIVAETPEEWIVACVVPEDTSIAFQMFPAVRLQSGGTGSNRGGGHEDSAPATTPVDVSHGLKSDLGDALFGEPLETTRKLASLG